MDIDPEVEDAEGLNYYQKTVLQTYRTSIGELSMPMYTTILEANELNPSIFHWVNILLIWFIWFIQSFFMLVIMMNFLIAVIVNTYDRVKKYQIRTEKT